MNTRTGKASDLPVLDGGLVSSLNTLGYGFLALATFGLVLGIACLCLAAPWEAAVGAFAGVFPSILTGVVFLWMSEVLYCLRRIGGHRAPG